MPLDLPFPIEADEIRRGLDAIGSLRVGVVGEAIIDEYAYCDSIGKSGKEPMLVTRFLECETQAGGALAVANHVAEFCREVELVTALGEYDRQEDFVRASLDSRVRPMLLTKSKAPTIVKRRYLDAYSKAKLLGVYRMDTAPLGDADAAQLREALEALCRRVDLVIVADYGHGLLGAAEAEQLCARAPYLALNTQLNADNGGYNTLSKYSRADYACLHEGEIRLDARDAHGELSVLLRRARERTGAAGIMATRGSKGTWLHTAAGDFLCPALATKVVERVGAGDALLALSSAAMRAGLSPAVVSVLANLAGAQAVAHVGNQGAIRKSALLAHLDLRGSGPTARRSA